MGAVSKPFNPLKKQKKNTHTNKQIKLHQYTPIRRVNVCVCAYVRACVFVCARGGSYDPSFCDPSF